MKPIYHNLFDSHCHSENSPDGVHSVTFLAESAIRAGVQGFAVTDHFECDLLEEKGFEMRMRQSVLDVTMARSAFRGQVIITTGIELGQPAYNMAGAEHILAGRHFDFVLLSLHRLQGYPDFYDIDYTGWSREDLHSVMLQYWQELLELVRWGKFDVLAHLTFPLRYPRLYANLDVDLTRYREQIDAVLRELVQSGKGLELNTSGLRSALDSTLPPPWVIRRFRELGGEIVTIGSDAHTAPDIGAGLADGMEILREAGFEQFAFFRDRSPVMLRII